MELMCKYFIFYKKQKNYQNGLFIILNALTENNIDNIAFKIA